MSHIAQQSQHNAQKQVDFLLVAEFNIDKGSSITHQYPAPTKIPEQLIIIPSHLPFELSQCHCINGCGLSQGELVVVKKGSY